MTKQRGRGKKRRKKAEKSLSAAAPGPSVPSSSLGAAAKDWAWLAVAALMAAQWIVLRAAAVPLGHEAQALLAGLAILGAAFILSWAAEAAQKDIPQALALIALAWIAVLPEYAVDLYFAWVAGKDPSYVAYATANMTGANRLLIGLGWPAVLLAIWCKSRVREIALEPTRRIELGALGLATLYAFLIPIKGTLSLLDAVVLIGIFLLYAYWAARSPMVEIDLEGPAERVASWPAAPRRAMVVVQFVFAGAAILFAAEPFAEGLLGVGREHGIEEFILVQWLAPLASEAPEFIVAILFALRGRAAVGLGALLSAKVNQWTLLVGAIPVVHGISAGAAAPMLLDFRQREEILLTAAQSLLGLMVLVNLRFGLREALLLAVLFLAQLFFPTTEVRLAFSVLYGILCIALLFRRGEWKAMKALAHPLSPGAGEKP
jgi:cation:H+ antiporter